LTGGLDEPDLEILGESDSNTEEINLDKGNLGVWGKKQNFKS